MIGLFSFDGPMYRDCNGVYCNTTITSEMFSRYFQVVDKLIVVIRTMHLEVTYEEANLKKVEFNGLEFVEIPNLNSINGFLIDRQKYKKVIKEQVEKADLIFARMPSVISDITIYYARKMKKQYMVEVGGCAWDAYWNHGLKGKLVAPYMFLNELKGVKHADFATYVTEDWLQKRYPSNCNAISASNVYLEELSEEVLNMRYKKIRSKKKDAPMIIGTTAAVNVKYKGQEYIIKAISELNRKGFNFEYELVGGGDNSYLKKIAESEGVADKVRFKGLMLQSEVFKWLDSIDVYAQPSKQEGLPRALIEALSRGCPAIGSMTAGIPELIQPNMLFEKGHIKQICSILIEITKVDLSTVASENFSRAKKFELENLDNKRRKIYKEYSKSIITKCN